MILTVPFSRARDLNSSSSPARTVRSFIERSTIARPSAISSGSVFRENLQYKDKTFSNGSGI